MNKYLLLLIIGTMVLESSCTSNQKSQTEQVNTISAVQTDATIEQTENLQQVGSLRDKEEIQNLIRQVLKWANSKNTIEILPVLTDNQDSVYIGFDLRKHKSNLGKLRATNFFATEFIENYNQIILTLDKKLRNHEFEEWLVGDLPTFRFANDVNPWCACQDYPDDNPWDVEIEVVELNNDKAQLIWRWGDIENLYFTLKEFSYKFRAVKENGKWKISYLQEFDFEESTLVRRSV